MTPRSWGGRITQLRYLLRLSRRTSPQRNSEKFVGRAPLEAKQSPTEKKMIRVSPPSKRAKPDLAIWAHQARQTSGQALEAFRRGKLKPAHSSHLPHSTLYSDYVSCFRAHSALEYRTFGPSRL